MADTFTLPRSAKPAFQDVEEAVYKAVSEGTLKTPALEKIDFQAVIQKGIADDFESAFAPVQKVLDAERNALAHLVTGQLHGQDTRGLYNAVDSDPNVTPANALQTELNDAQADRRFLGITQGAASEKAYREQLHAAAQTFVQSAYPEFSGQNKARR